MILPASLFPQTAVRVAEWQAKPEVLGVVQVGSKSRGYEDALSDDDLEILLTDEAFAKYAPAECLDFLIEGEGATRRIIYDSQLTTLTDLERKALSTRDLDHWPYERAQVLFDRDGRVADAVRAAAVMPAEFRRARIHHAAVDAWTSTARAQKTLRRDFKGSAHLLAARACVALTRVLFALESRWVPLDHWLERELQTLKDESRIVPLLLDALHTMHPDSLDAAIQKLEDRLAAEGVARPAERRGFFLTLIHPTRAAERAIHGLP